jgi:hypothetical protein
MLLLFADVGTLETSLLVKMVNNKKTTRKTLPNSRRITGKVFPSCCGLQK